MVRHGFVVLAFVGILGLTGCNPVLSTLQPSPSGSACDTALVVAETSWDHGGILHRNWSLDAAAQAHSEQMASGAGLTHDGWDGQIRFSGYSGGAIGQNIAYGFAASNVTAAWMASPDHRANITNGAYRDIGVGCAESGGTLWWTENFGG